MLCSNRLGLEYSENVLWNFLVILFFDLKSFFILQFLSMIYKYQRARWSLHSAYVRRLTSRVLRRRMRGATCAGKIESSGSIICRVSEFIINRSIQGPSKMVSKVSKIERWRYKGVQQTKMLCILFNEIKQKWMCIVYVCVFLFYLHYIYC